MPAADKTLHLVSSVTTEQTQLELALEGRHRPGQSRDRPPLRSAGRLPDPSSLVAVLCQAR